MPDARIQAVYYYRWQTYKEHLVYTGAEYGYLSNEFLTPVFYGAPYGGIVAAAGHHINEGRWLRDQQYVKDVINYWLAGPGQFPKPMVESVNPNTSDWAHEYSFWAASSVWQHYLITGDKAFAIGQLPNLIKQYRGWDNQFNSSLGLYWQVPVWDATELTPVSYEYCATGTGDNLALAGNAGWRAYTMDASVLANGAPLNAGIALIARAQDSSHYYQAEFKRTSAGYEWTVSKNDGGTWTLLASGPYTWPSGAGKYMNIRFSVQGDTLTMGVWQPGGTWQTLGTGRDAQYASGRMGLRTWGGLTGSFDLVHVHAG